MIIMLLAFPRAQQASALIQPQTYLWLEVAVHHQRVKVCQSLGHVLCNLKHLYIRQRGVVPVVDALSQAPTTHKLHNHTAAARVNRGKARCVDAHESRRRARCAELDLTPQRAQRAGGVGDAGMGCGQQLDGHRAATPRGLVHHTKRAAPLCVRVVHAAAPPPSTQRTKRRPKWGAISVSKSTSSTTSDGSSMGTHVVTGAPGVAQLLLRGSVW